MITDIKLPHLGENIEEGQVVKVLANVGDRVEEGQNVLELETEKASIEIPVEFSGIVKKFHISEGETLAVGQVFITIDRNSIDPASQKTKSRIVEDKIEKTPPNKEIIEEKKPAKEDKYKVNIEDKIRPIKGISTSPRSQSPTVPASPSTRRFAREIGVDISEVPGSGPRGRISIGDVKAYSKNLRSGDLPSSLAHSPIMKPMPDFLKWGEVETHSMTNIRKKTAERLSYCWTTIPHVTQFDKADITELEKQRKISAKHVEKFGGKLTLTGILMKIVARILREFPQFNASIDVSKNLVLHKKYYNIGIAVDTDRGLLVPVVRNVDQKNLAEISLELSDLAEKTRNKKIGIEEMSGGTFTISNLGGIGGTAFTPIVNWPEVAILGVAKSRIEPVYVDGELKPRNILTLALSYDHRIIDGADGVRFLLRITQALENPLIVSL